MRKIKAYAIVTKRGLLVGGGDKYYGYTPLCVYSTRQGAKNALNKGRNDRIIICEIVL